MQASEQVQCDAGEGGGDVPKRDSTAALSNKSEWVILRTTPLRANMLQKCERFCLAMMLVIGLGLEAADVQAATLDISADPEGQCSALTLSGEIKRGDHTALVAAINDARHRAPLRRLYLNSSGGDVLTALAMSNIFRDLTPEIETIVEPRSSCNSACILVLASGARQRVSAEASVVVHLAYDPATGVPSPGISLGMAHFLVGRGMSTEVVKTVEELQTGQTIAITPSNAKAKGFTTLTFFGGSHPPATKGCTWPGFISRE